MDILHSIRILDIDDLYILTYLSEGKLMVEAARALQLSQAALTQRIQKIETHLEIKVLKKDGAKRILTPHGLKLATAAAQALACLQVDILSVTDESGGQVKLLKSEQYKPQKQKRKYQRKNNCGFLGPNV